MTYEEKNQEIQTKVLLLDAVIIQGLSTQFRDAQDMWDWKWSGGIESNCYHSSAEEALQHLINWLGSERKTKGKYADW